MYTISIKLDIKGEKMKATGIVVEYNPFHNGHRYHLEKAKEHGVGDVVIAVMSGDYLQRGEPAILNKWMRTEMALKNGIDIVVELPSFYSTQSAEIFAKGSVEILGNLGVSDIVFGSEGGDVNILEGIADLEENEVFQELLKNYLSLGRSYPSAFSMALDEISGGQERFNPNDILGIEYVRAIKKGRLDIKPIAIKREGSGYHSEDLDSIIASATAIRKALKESKSIEKLVPNESYHIIIDGIKEKKLTYLEEYYPLIRHEIILNKDKLSEIQDVEVGYENKLYSAAFKYRDFYDFYNEILSKRYTNARVQRVLVHVLIGLTREITRSVKKKVPFIRVLGFNERGNMYLKGIKKEMKVPLLSSLKNVTKILDDEAKSLLDFNEKASKIYGIVKEYDEMKRPIILKGDEDE